MRYVILFSVLAGCLSCENAPVGPLVEEYAKNLGETEVRYTCISEEVLFFGTQCTVVIRDRPVHLTCHGRGYCRAK